MQAATPIIQAFGLYRPVAGRGNLSAKGFGCGAYSTRGCKGVTLIELLCVCAIITILASMLLPAVLRAYRRAKAMQEEFDAPVVSEWLLASTRNYCASHPKYNFDSKNDFADKCDLHSKCRAWINASPTQFVPFNHLAPSNLVVLTFHYGPKYASTRAFNIAELSIRPAD